MKQLVHYIALASVTAAVLQGPPVIAETLVSFPILERLQSQGHQLSKETGDWMKKWRGMDLDSNDYQFKELSGSTSINLKIRKIDPADAKGYKSRGTFVPLNGAANPDTEIAYFNLAAILGYDAAFRPVARYELGPKASLTFKALIEHWPIRGRDRLENKANILREIASGKPLRGCVKAKKLDSSRAYDEIASNGTPTKSNPIVLALQAANHQPRAGETIDLGHGYRGDALQLAREYSVIMTLDAIFRQWDRYSGGNVVIAKDDGGAAHFYATDNGGADVSSLPAHSRNVELFSRYDGQVIENLKALNRFLKSPETGFVGYTNAESFVVDLGLYRQYSPSNYVERLRNNLDFFLDHVSSNEKKHGANVYFSSN